MYVLVVRLLVALLLSVSSELRAQNVAFDNFGPNNGISLQGSWFGHDVNPSTPKIELAQRIVPLIGGQLGSIEAAIWPRYQVTDAVLQLTIHEEVNGRPSNHILWQQTYSPVQATEEISKFEVTEPVRLEQGIPVWLSAAELTTLWRPLGWSLSSVASGVSAIRGAGVLPAGSWRLRQPGLNTYAVRMNLVPEPTALLLIGLGAFGLVGRRL